MQYKLSKYEDSIRTQLGRCYPTCYDLGMALDYYERNAKYRNFEKSAIWACWRVIARIDCYALYGKMREEVPDFKDEHIETLMRNAIKKNYGLSIPNLLQLYRKIAQE